ncbi:ABC transporter substrate-binding protein [Nonomuraea rubra]|uniref:ABC transporter substrate-binding protein n=1 Tax=Nonomuraea rubra TaxID=46180 RepID=UPI003618588D
MIAGTKFNVGLYAALKRAGYQGVLTDATSYDVAILKDPASAQALEGVVAAPMFEPFESTAPEIAKLKADVEKVAPGTQLTQHLAIGYWAADIFLDMLNKTGKDLTRRSSWPRATARTCTRTPASAGSSTRRTTASRTAAVPWSSWRAAPSRWPRA